MLILWRMFLSFAKKIVDNFDQCFEAVLFGGIEKEIIDRGTDWCTDISRVGVALLQCLNIPARIAIVVNRSVAYHGHQVVEAYINNQYVMCDFLYGLMGFTNEAAAVKDLLKNQRLVREIYQQKIRCKEQLDTLVGLYGQGAISEYCIMKSNTYKVSKANEYYLKMMTLEHDGNWLLNEK